MSEMEALPSLGSRCLSAAPSSTGSSFPVWSSTGATASCQARRTPIKVARESSSEETPSARRKASVDTSPTQPAYSSSSRGPGALPGPASVTEAVAAIANATATKGSNSASPPGMRAAKSASRERPVTTSSRKTPAARSLPPALRERQRSSRHPQPGGDLQEPLLERCARRLEAMDGQGRFDEEAVDVCRGILGRDRKVGTEGDADALGRLRRRPHGGMRGQQ